MPGPIKGDKGNDPGLEPSKDKEEVVLSTAILFHRNTAYCLTCN
jgi:hypothetical protein